MPYTDLLKPEFISKAGNIQLVARAVVEGFITGLHKSPFKGFSSEFAEFREYIPGDELKYLDWKVFGKSDRLVVREFHEETNLKSFILLDRSASLDYTSGELTKFRYGQFLAASLAYFLVRQQDSVGLVTFGDEIDSFLKPGSTPVHLQNVLSVLDSTQPEGITDLTGVFHKLAEGLTKRGLIIIISDLYDEQENVKKALSHFLHKKHEVILYHLFDPAELNLDFRGPVDLMDIETGERLEVVSDVIRDDYKRNLEEFLNAYREMGREGNFDYVLADTSKPFYELLLQYLRKRERIH